MLAQPEITLKKEVVTTAQVIIRAQHLKKRFGGNIVLDDFNVELRRGENVVVLGRSGTGKSVFIKCIIGLMLPDEGTIEVLGENIAALNDEQLDRLRAKVGFLFQSNALYDSLTVSGNLEFPLRRHWIELPQQEVDALVTDVLQNVGLEHTVDMMPVELSGGMRKRIALARTLILKPEIILYDEPTTGLDPITGKEISELMVALQKKYNTSSIIIAHDMNCVKLTADRIVLLMDGKCYVQGTYDELKKSKDPIVKNFFE